VATASSAIVIERRRSLRRISLWVMAEALPPLLVMPRVPSERRRDRSNHLRLQPIAGGVFGGIGYGEFGKSKPKSRWKSIFSPRRNSRTVRP